MRKKKVVKSSAEIKAQRRIRKLERECDLSEQIGYNSGYVAGVEAEQGRLFLALFPEGLVDLNGKAVVPKSFHRPRS